MPPPDEPPRGVRAPRRYGLPWLAPSGYGLVVAWRDSEGPGGRFVLLATASLLLARAASRRTQRAAQLTLLGLSWAAAGLAAPAFSRGGAVYLGAGAALVATVALAAALAAPSPPGLLARRPPFPRGRVLAVGALLGVPLLFAAAEALGAGWAAVGGSASIAGGAAATFALLTGSLGVDRVRRRLELGLPHRLGAALFALGLAALTGVALALSRALLPQQVVPLALALGAAGTTAAFLARDAVAVARGSRRLATLLLAATLATFAAFVLFDGRPGTFPVAVAMAASAGALLAAAAPVLERALLPEQGQWLRAFALAQGAFRRFEPEDALREALLALRAAAGPGAPSPALFTLWPPRELTVDAAGYARERDGELPEGLSELLASEPEATVRSEVLDALVVRKPGLRRLSAWLDQRDAQTATLVTRSGEAEGVLLVPRGRRSEPLTLEEARALKELADAFAGACAARAALARSHERELAARDRADAKEDEALRLAHGRALQAGRDALAHRRLAAPAAVGMYSAAARLAWDALERRARNRAPLWVVAPSGVDPVPWLARAHGEGPRAEAPFVVVEGTATEEHRVESWQDARTSPLALAAGGTLVLRDGAALPKEVQQLLARALAERRTPWEQAEPLELAVWVTTTRSPAELLARGELDDAFAARLESAVASPVFLPHLADRAEDLRALVTERLAREGLRVRGAPVGIDAAAFALLVEHDFPGEDAELDALVVRLVKRVDGAVVRASDVRAAGLGAPREGLAPVVELRSGRR